MDVQETESSQSQVKQAQSLPFSDKMGPGGQWTVVYLCFDYQSKRSLVAWSKKFRLATSGDTATLKRRLKRFSRNRSRWDSLLHQVTPIRATTRVTPPTSQPTLQLPTRQSTDSTAAYALAVQKAEIAALLP
ncbi:hypothetical protein BJ138DRAFT_1107297 [Hygrophoropsis aurantiaca]|uniref:Uncharacterized protein n=1 Tax=Hygrophoropsis aurantiaca TaxID=72124 RepID=A0ACB7ZSI4_9AGAM|nr:hypothetical protein BJ138DRAFT_1107297 [Hygrophoropsis aurantiaca]